MSLDLKIRRLFEILPLHALPGVFAVSVDCRGRWKCLPSPSIYLSSSFFFPSPSLHTPEVSPSITFNEFGSDLPQ